MNNLSIKAICVLTILAGFIFSSQAPRIHPMGKAIPGIDFSGTAYMKVTSNNEVMVALSSSANDTIDRIFLLSVDPSSPVTLKTGDLDNTNLFFYEDQRGLVLHAAKGNSLYFLGLDGATSVQKIDSIKSTKLPGERFGGQALGFGLAAYTGKWSKQVIMNTTKKFAGNILVLADLIRKASTTQIKTAVDDTNPYPAN
jgi:hypothetical protein